MFLWHIINYFFYTVLSRTTMFCSTSSTNPSTQFSREQQCFCGTSSTIPSTQFCHEKQCFAARHQLIRLLSSVVNNNNFVAHHQLILFSSVILLASCKQAKLDLLHTVDNDIYHKCLFIELCISAYRSLLGAPMHIYVTSTMSSTKSKIPNIHYLLEKNKP